MAHREFPLSQWSTSQPGPEVDVAEMDHALGLLEHQQSELGTTHALVVVHRGAVVRELYGPDTTPESTHISWSMAKSITQALVGMAVKDGLLSIDDSHLFDHWTDGRQDITLGNLLNMSSGLEWVEDYVDDKVSDVIEMLFGDGGFAGDHAGYAASKPLEAQPGTKYLYSSGTTNLITHVLARALGEKVGTSEVITRFMNERLFAPIGMTSAISKCDGAGNFVGSSYVFATARDFARFGYLYLNDGVWNNERLLPEDWVSYARTPIARDPDNGFDYGAHWWMSPDDKGSMAALGYEGQFTWVSPSRDLVVVRLGKTDIALAPALRQQLLRIIRAFPAHEMNIGNDGTYG